MFRRSRAETDTSDGLLAPFRTQNRQRRLAGDPATHHQTDEGGHRDQSKNSEQHWTAVTEEVELEDEDRQRPATDHSQQSPGDSGK